MFLIPILTVEVETDRWKSTELFFYKDANMVNQEMYAKNLECLINN